MDNVIVKYFDQVFQAYGWWSLLLVLLTFGLMIPINLLVKKLFEKSISEPMDRLRKTISSGLVYVVAFALSYIYVAIFKVETTAAIVFGNSLPVAVLAMGLWSVVKLARDGAIKPLLKKYQDPVKAKLKEITGVDAKIIDNIYGKLVEYVKDSDVENAEMVLNHEKELLLKSIDMLTGFTENVSSSDIASQLYECLKLKFVKKQKGEKNEIPSK